MTLQMHSMRAPCASCHAQSWLNPAHELDGHARSAMRHALHVCSDMRASCTLCMQRSRSVSLICLACSQVVLSLPNARQGTGGPSDVQFAGTLEPCKDDMDCVLLFDGASFRLETIGLQVKARCATGLIVCAAIPACT